MNKYTGQLNTLTLKNADSQTLTNDSIFSLLKETKQSITDLNKSEETVTEPKLVENLTNTPQILPESSEDKNYKPEETVTDPKKSTKINVEVKRSNLLAENTDQLKTNTVKFATPENLSEKQKLLESDIMRLSGFQHSLRDDNLINDEQRYWSIEQIELLKKLVKQHEVIIELLQISSIINGNNTNFNNQANYISSTDSNHSIKKVKDDIDPTLPKWMQKMQKAGNWFENATRMLKGEQTRTDGSLFWTKKKNSINDDNTDNSIALSTNDIISSNLQLLGTNVKKISAGATDNILLNYLKNINLNIVNIAGMLKHLNDIKQKEIDRQLREDHTLDDFKKTDNNVTAKDILVQTHETNNKNTDNKEPIGSDDDSPDADGGGGSNILSNYWRYHHHPGRSPKVPKGPKAPPAPKAPKAPTAPKAPKAIRYSRQTNSWIKTPKPQNANFTTARLRHTRQLQQAVRSSSNAYRATANITKATNTMKNIAGGGQAIASTSTATARCWHRIDSERNTIYYTKCQ